MYILCRRIPFYIYSFTSENHGRTASEKYPFISFHMHSFKTRANSADWKCASSDTLLVLQNNAKTHMCPGYWCIYSLCCRKKHLMSSWFTHQSVVNTLWSQSNENQIIWHFCISVHPVSRNTCVFQSSFRLSLPSPYPTVINHLYRVSEELLLWTFPKVSFNSPNSVFNAWVKVGLDVKVVKGSCSTCSTIKQGILSTTTTTTTTTCTTCTTY